MHQFALIWKEANKRFSDTITALDDLEGVVGKKLRIDGPNADKAFGKELRALINDTKGRANLMDAVSGIEQTAHKYGGSFDDNILRQMLFADELELALRQAAKDVDSGDGVLFLTDIPGGSPANRALAILMDTPNVELIGGANCFVGDF